jgi:hypothetical protein
MGNRTKYKDIIYVRREDGREVAKLISAPGLDGTEAYVLEENTEAAPKTTRKTLKAPSAQIKKTKIKNKTSTEIGKFIKLISCLFRYYLNWE